MISCPVCDKEMKLQTANTFVCKSSPIKVPELLEDKELEINHAVYCMNKDGNITFKTIQVPPYIFEIHDDPNSIRQTRISKLIKPNYDYKAPPVWCRVDNHQFMIEELVKLPVAVNIQWNNTEAVIERIKMYMLFS